MLLCGPQYMAQKLQYRAGALSAVKAGASSAIDPAFIAPLMAAGLGTGVGALAAGKGKRLRGALIGGAAGGALGGAAEYGLPGVGLGLKYKTEDIGHALHNAITGKQDTWGEDMARKINRIPELMEYSMRRQSDLPGGQLVYGDLEKKNTAQDITFLQGDSSMEFKYSARKNKRQQQQQKAANMRAFGAYVKRAVAEKRAEGEGELTLPDPHNPSRAPAMMAGGLGGAGLGALAGGLYGAFNPGEEETVDDAGNIVKQRKGRLGAALRGALGGGLVGGGVGAGVGGFAPNQIAKLQKMFGSLKDKLPQLGGSKPPVTPEAPKSEALKAHERQMAQLSAGGGAAPEDHAALLAAGDQEPAGDDPNNLVLPEQLAQQRALFQEAGRLQELKDNIGLEPNTQAGPPSAQQRALFQEAGRLRELTDNIGLEPNTQAGPPSEADIKQHRLGGERELLRKYPSAGGDVGMAEVMSRRPPAPQQ